MGDPAPPDVTAHVRLPDEIEQARAMLAASRDAIVLFDAAGRVTAWNVGAARLYGYEAGEVIGHAVLDHLVEPVDADLVLAHLVAGEHVPPFDAVIRAADGSSLTVNATVFGLYDDDGCLTGIGSVAHDVTETRRLEAEARRQRLYDDVTGLPNRRLVTERIGDALEHGPPPAVVCVDLDGFRLINDTWGHATGDEVLDEVGRRLSTVIAASDVVGRLGADQFVIVRRDSSLDELEHLAQAIAEALQPPVAVRGRPQLNVQASVGIAVARHHVRPEDLLRDADTAVHRAKRRGRGNVVWFSDELRADAARRLLLQTDLRAALDDGALAVVYQPIVSLAGCEVVAVEALARWTHPVLGPISPLEFIAVAEEADLIGRLGATVLDLACAAVAAERPELGVAVNLSTVQLHDPGLVDAVVAATALHGVDPCRLRLEVVEAALGDGDEALRSLLGLRALGCRISVDDFGTGWSSLARLKELPIDEVKIDRSFVAGLPHDQADVAVVDAVVRLARSLGLDVVAEGVETDEQLAAVRELGCDAAQGFLLGMPGTM